MSSLSRSRTSRQGPRRPHKIFQLCLKCGFDTLRFPDPPRLQVPTYVCPQCRASTFVHSCSECRFTRSTECPLTKLLDEISIPNLGKKRKDAKPEPVQTLGRPDPSVKIYSEDLAERLQAIAFEIKNETFRGRMPPSVNSSLGSRAAKTNTTDTQLVC